MSTHTISPLRQRMIDDLNARQRSPATQKSHIRGCKRFTVFLRRSPETATPDDIRAFQLHLAETGVSVCTRNQVMTGVKFLFRVTLRRPDLVEEIYHLREPERIPVVLSQDEAKQLLAMAANLKVRTMLSLGYGCGMRAGEVVRLKVGDIDSGQNIIRIVQSKGLKDRNVMLSPKLLMLLRQWWKERRSEHDVDVPMQQRYLFPGRGSYKPLSPRQFSRLFQETATAANIRKPVTLHSLRHSFATHLYERGVDIRMIQALLGHTKLETTARYARVATGMIASVESPLDVLSKLTGNKKGYEPLV